MFYENKNKLKKKTPKKSFGRRQSTEGIESFKGNQIMNVENPKLTQ